jgi:DNA-binding transcriptional regulator YdaS (Cro superfamily)
MRRHTPRSPAARRQPDLALNPASRRLVIGNALATHGVTQAAVAAALRVHPQAVSQVIAGRTTSARIRRALAAYTGLRVRHLWPPDARPRKARARARLNSTTARETRTSDQCTMVH